MKRGIFILPNGITLCGMTCGFYSIQASLHANYEHAAWAILLATIFDALDGWIARITNSASRFGVQLDSLSDMLTFCAAPAILVLNWKLRAVNNVVDKVGWAVALFFVLCGALRLARYNVQVDSAESRNFTGMPTPGAAIALAAFTLVGVQLPPDFPGVRYVLLALTFLLGILMVSTIRYHSAKEILMRKRKPFWWLVLFAAVLILISSHPPEVILVCVLVYVFSGLAEECYHRVTRNSARHRALPTPPPTTPC